MTSNFLAGRPCAGSLVEGRVELSSSQKLSVVNPARPTDVVCDYVVADENTVERAIASVAHGVTRWSRRSGLDRGRILRRAAGILGERREEMSELLTREEGKTISDSRGEVDRGIEILEYHASSAWWPQGETFNATAGGDVAFTARVPVGVVGLITPWNFPLSIPLWKLAPALVHGNGVVWKPSTLVPLLSMRIGEILLDAGVDADAFAMVLGDAEVGELLVNDPRIAGISFTGSEAVGRIVGAACARRGAKAQLELGGHNPAIVLADAHLDVFVDSMVRSIANQTGQKCTAARRIIIEDSVYDDAVSALVVRFASLRVGDGLEPGVDLGPLVRDSARAIVEAAVEQSIHEGCRLLGSRPSVPEVGAFMAPTLLEADDQKSVLCREEVFGPVSVILRARDVDEAFSMARDTRFGLSAGLFTSSERMVRRAVQELPVGLLNINRPTTSAELHMPFGGMRASSAPGPAEQGMAAREFFTETRTVISNAVE